MIARLRALHTHVERLKLRREADKFAAGRNDALDRALEVLEAAGFGSGTSDAADEILRLRAALERIERWEFPATGEFFQDGSPVSYGTAYGANGELDFMRKIARAALAGPAASEPQP